jgi:hypothetical protein
LYLGKHFKHSRQPNGQPSDGERAQRGILGRVLPGQGGPVARARGLPGGAPQPARPRLPIAPEGRAAGRGRAEKGRGRERVPARQGAPTWCVLITPYSLSLSNYHYTCAAPINAFVLVSSGRVSECMRVLVWRRRSRRTARAVLEYN